MFIKCTILEFYMHLRDVPTPVFFVASRGHHADIGGITPGSMPPHSTSLSQVREYGFQIDFKRTIHKYSILL